MIERTGQASRAVRPAPAARGCGAFAALTWVRLAVGFSMALVACGARGGDLALCFGGGGTVEAPAPNVPADAKGPGVEFRFIAHAVPAQALRAVAQWSDDPKAADSSAFHVDLAPGNRLACTLRVGKGRSITVTSKTAWDLHRWHHAAATWDGSTLTVYLDGKAAGDQRLAGAAVAPSPLPLIVGQPVSSSAKRGAEGPGLKGFIADVAVWSVAPAADAVARHAAKGIAADEPGLAASLPLRQAAPGATAREAVSGREAKLSEGLARAGWCATTGPDEPAAAGMAPLHLFSYDLSAPARPKQGTAAPGGDALPALTNPRRMILIQNARSGQFGVLWQDQEKAGNGIYVTWVDPDLGGHETVRLAGAEDGILAAGCADPSGNLCYLEIQKAPASAGRDATTALKAFLHGAAADGKALGKVPVDTTAAGKGLNVWNYGGRWGGSMAYQNGAFALILPRTMYQSPDGLNHQGAIAVVFPAGDPANYKNFGQITGHSFGNVLTTNSAGAFVGLDLGDCYPRGVNLHKFTPAAKASKVVFTYKTQHATSPRGGSPKYDEISTGGKTFYKWSNDNNTYTELGGAIEGRVSYSVVFATDRSVEGRVLDNSRAFGGCDDPRDLAMVRVVKDFERVRGTNEVSDALLAGGAPDGSAAETGGFYNFAGNWTKQREAGVIWLTRHKSGEAAHAPHPVRLKDGSALIVWEKTSPEGASLRATRAGEDGKLLGEAALPGSALHLNREDPAVAAGGRAYFLATEKGGGARLCFVYEDFPLGPVAMAGTGTGPGKPAASK